MFQCDELNDRIDITMSPDLTHIDRADDRITEWIGRHPRPIDLFALRILVREAVLNAVEHGCRRHPDGTVGIQLEARPAEIALTVSDPGPGFDWRGHASYRDELAEGGRGLALMEIYSDRMDYNEAGNRVTLTLTCKVEPVISRTNQSEAVATDPTLGDYHE